MAIYYIDSEKIKNYKNNLKEEYEMFKQAKNYYDNSYLNHSSESILQEMKQELFGLYKSIDKEYSSIINWWDSYIEDYEKLEEKIIKETTKSSSFSWDSITNIVSKSFSTIGKIASTGATTISTKIDEISDIFEDLEIKQDNNKDGFFSNLFNDYSKSSVISITGTNNNSNSKYDQNELYLRELKKIYNTSIDDIEDEIKELKLKRDRISIYDYPPLNRDNFDDYDEYTRAEQERKEKIADLEAPLDKEIKEKRALQTELLLRLKEVKHNLFVLEYDKIKEESSYKEFDQTYSVSSLYNYYKNEKNFYEIDYLAIYEYNGDDGTIKIDGTKLSLSDIYKYTTEDEKKMYHYLYKVKGREEAFDYLENLIDNINQAKGVELANAWIEEYELYQSYLYDEDNYGLNILANIASRNSVKIKGLKDGVSSFFDGMGNIVKNDGYLSPDEYARSIVYTYLNENTDIEKYRYSFYSSLGNMIPSLATSAIANWLLTPAGAATLVVGGETVKLGNVIGSGLMGLSAFGNAKHQALVNGASTSAATLYGAIIGGSETLLGYFLGKIPGLSKTKSILTNEQAMTLKSYLKELAVDMAKEGGEEFLQEFIDAGCRSTILGEDIDASSLGYDAFCSFIIGALMSGYMTGAGTAVNITINGTKIKLSEIASKLDNLTLENAKSKFNSLYNDLTGKTAENNAKIREDLKNLWNKTKETLSNLATDNGGFVNLNLSNNKIEKLFKMDIYGINDFFEKYNDFENNVNFFNNEYGVNNKTELKKLLVDYINNNDDIKGLYVYSYIFFDSSISNDIIDSKSFNNLVKNNPTKIDQIIDLIYNDVDSKKVTELLNVDTVRDYINQMSFDDFNTFFKKTKNKVNWIESKTIQNKIKSLNYKEKTELLSNSLYSISETLKKSDKANEISKFLFEIFDYNYINSVLSSDMNPKSAIGILNDLNSIYIPYDSPNRERVNDINNYFKNQSEKLYMGLLNKSISKYKVDYDSFKNSYEKDKWYTIEYEENGISKKINKKFSSIYSIYIVDELKYDANIRDINIKSIKKNNVLNDYLVIESNDSTKIASITYKVNGEIKKAYANKSGNKYDFSSALKNITDEIEIIKIDKYESKNINVEEQGLYKVKLKKGSQIVEYTITTDLFGSKKIDVDTFLKQKDMFDYDVISFEKVDISSISYNVDNYSSGSKTLLNSRNGASGGSQNNFANIFEKKIKNEILTKTEQNKIETTKKIIEKYYSNLTDVEILKLAETYAVRGCNYMSYSNALMAYFSQFDSKEFKNRFGFDLYYLDESGNKKYNYEALAMDIFLDRFKGYSYSEIIKNSEGINRLDYEKVITNYLRNKNVEVEVDIIGNLNYAYNDALIAKFISEHNNDIITLGGTTFDMELVYESEEFGGVNYDAAVDSSNSKTVKVGGGHSVTLLSTKPNGDILVSSWGKIYSISKDQLKNLSMQSINFSLK